VAHLHFDDYIMSKINDVAHYFQPAASKFEQWACKSEALEESKHMTLRTFQTAPQWLLERRISARWTEHSESSELERTSSIYIRVKQIRTVLTTASLHEVARLIESLHGLINEIQRQHSPKLLDGLAVNEVNSIGDTGEHNMLQATMTLKTRSRNRGRNRPRPMTTRSRNRPRSDHGLNSHVFHCELYIEHRFRPRVQVVSSKQQNWGHVLQSHANHESNVLVANKPLENHARGQLRCRWHVDHDKFQLCDDKKLVSTMNLGDKIEFVAWLKIPVFSRHECIFSRRDHICRSTRSVRITMVVRLT